MSVIPFRKPRRKGFRGHVREAVSEALNSIGEPVAFFAVALDESGGYSVRTVSGEISDFDMYARAGAVLEKQKLELMS